MKTDRLPLVALVTLVVALVGFLVPWDEGGGMPKDGGLGPESPKVRASPVGATASAPRQTPTARNTYPFEVRLKDGALPRGLSGLVRRVGARIVSYLPRGGAIVEATDAEVAQLRAMREIASVGECEPSSKFAPGFRERLAQAGADESVRVSFSLLNAADVATLSQRIVASGGSVLCGTDPKPAFQWVSAELPAGRIAAFANQAEIKWLEPVSRIRFCNATAVKTDRMDVERAWDNGAGLGLSGAGQVIGHMDTGIDYGTTNNLAPEFAGHIKAYFDLTGGTSLPDTKGHGTHTAGSIVGQGVPELGGKFRGVAFGAELVHHALGAREYVLVDDLNTIFAQTYGLGARIHSNSMGDGNCFYDALAQSVDAFVWEHPNFLPVVAAGNLGPSAGTISSPAAAKCALAVGASENHLSAEPEAVRRGLMNASSRGARIGRIKPDIVAPGEGIVSLRSLALPEICWWCPVYTNEAACGERYGWMSGTSMATPLAAGAMALMREWYLKTRGEEPSAAMLAAMAVGGAHTLYPGRYAYPTNTQMTVCGPNPDEGWGEIGVAATLAPTNGTGVVLYDARLDRPGETVRNEIALYVTNSTETLTVALSWTDYPSDPREPGLVNDYDLELCAPDGTVYYPNGLSRADTNNVHEVTVVTNAAAGRWTAAIRSDNVRLSFGGAVALYARGALGSAADLPDPPQTIRVKDDAALTEALDAARSGDTLELAAGAYTPFAIRGKALTVVGAGADKTVIDGGCTTRCVYVESPGGYDQVVLEGVTIQNGYEETGAGICGGTLRHSIIRNCRATHRGGGASGALLDHCVISNCWVEGVTNPGFQPDDETYLEGGGADASLLYDCLVAHCGVSNVVKVAGVSCLSQGGGVSRSDLFNVTVVDSQMVWNDYGGTRVDAEFIRTNTCAVAIAGSFDRGGNVQNSLFSRARINGVEDAYGFWSNAQCCHLAALATNDFVSFATDDFRLSSNAVRAVDCGVSGYLDNYPTSSLPRLDLTGSPRVQGRSVDLGCYESPYTNVAPVEVSGTIRWPGNVYMVSMGVGDPAVELQDVSMVNDPLQLSQHATAYLAVPPDNIVLLTGTNVTCAAVSNALDGLVVRAQKDELVLLTISTHGSLQRDPTTGVPIVGSDNVAKLSDGSLAPDTIRDFESRLKAKGARLVCVCDFCHSGGFATMANVPALAAATEQERSYDTKPEGCFTEAFLSLWRRPPDEADLNGDGILSFHEMGCLLAQRYKGHPSLVVGRSEVIECLPETLATVPLRRMPTGAEPLAVLTTALPRMYSGMTYCCQLQATGGDGTNRWEALSELPGGLTLEAGGILHGLPQSVTMPTNLVVRVTDASGATATATLPVEDILFRVDSRPRIVSASTPPGLIKRKQGSGAWALRVSAEQPAATNDVVYVFSYTGSDETGAPVSCTVTNLTGELVVRSAVCEAGAVTVQCVVRQGEICSPDGTLTWVVGKDPGEPAKSFYLDPGQGSEEGSGTLLAPFWSFTNAIAAAGRAAETNILIYVDNSKNNHRFELDETIDVDVPGKRITFLPWVTIGSGDFSVVLDGQGECGCVMVNKDVQNTVAFSNFVLTNGYDKTAGAGAYRVTLVNCAVVDCKTDKRGGGVNDCVLKNCLISGCEAGLNGGGAYDSTLVNCLVVNNKAPNGKGGGAFHSSLYNCTFDGNTADYGGGFVSSTKTTNEVSAVEVVNSIILDNGTDDWTTNSERDGDVFRRVFTTGDPKFVDAALGDYRLRADSPCIDFGSLGFIDLPADDLAGNPRLRGAGLDLGCYEFPRHAAFPPGTLDVSTNAQVVGTVLYAQGPWRLAVEDSAGSWLSADVTSGTASNTLRFTFAANATGTDRSAVVSVFTNGSDTAVQQVTVRQVGRASGCAGTRRGVFIGCVRYALEPDVKKPKEKWEPWQKETPGSDDDALFNCGLWCKPSETNDPAVCKLLIDENATSNNVLAACETILAALRPEDEFMLTFSGHGGTDLPKWENSFVLHPYKEYLDFADLSNVLIRAAAKCAKAICCIDACNSAGAYKFADQLTCDGEITDRDDLPRLRFSAVAPSKSAPYADQPKIAFIVAADYDRFALSADEGEKNGLFTRAIREGYETGAADADGDGFLDLHELYRYAYHVATQESSSEDPYGFVQGRCYNKLLLLKTIVGRTAKASKPDVANPLNPYYVDFVNWIQDGTQATVSNPVSVTNVADVATNAANRVALAGGGSLTLAEAFVAGYEPVRKGATNEPFRVSIAVTNGTPYLSWSPDRRPDAVPMHTYAIRANTSLTNRTGWVTLPADATPEQLKSYNFFQVDVNLRQ